MRSAPSGRCRSVRRLARLDRLVRRVLLRLRLVGDAGDPRQRQPRRVLQRAQHHRRARLSDGGDDLHLPEELPDVLGVAPAELDQVAVLAGQVMHFEHTRNLRDQLAGPIRHVERTGRPDRHERQLAQADGLGIEQRRVARQDALGLQLPQPLEHRRRRQPDRTRDVSLRHPGVRLNHVQYLDVEIVKHALQLPLTENYRRPNASGQEDPLSYEAQRPPKNAKRATPVRESPFLRSTWERFTARDWRCDPSRPRASRPPPSRPSRSLRRASST